MEIAKFDLQLTVSPLEEDGVGVGMPMSLTYATDLFDESTVVSFAERLVRVLEAMVAEPDSVVGDVELLGEDERSQGVGGVNDTVHELTVGALLLDGFVAQVAASPDAVAVVFEGQSLSYAEFGSRVNRLARYWVSVGVGRSRWWRWRCVGRLILLWVCMRWLLRVGRMCRWIRISLRSAMVIFSGLRRRCVCCPLLVTVWCCRVSSMWC
ncbi:non-ribosomal peptide synthetase component F [Rhodococcus erythropolis]|nr:condensation domain-containing protein [Rhodococcus erythropolis]MCW2429549.1 non-ribosomal peptide synthetase component F [Rhodococcus erythropolis]